MENLKNAFDFISGNQLLLAGLGLSGAGMITFWIKDVPRNIFRFLKREFITELTITNHNRVYYDFLKFLETEYKDKSFRHVKLSNGWSGDDDISLTIGYGVHFIRYKKHWLLIDLTKDAANQTVRDKESIRIAKFGRSKKLFNNLIKDLLKISDTDNDCLELYNYSDNYWCYKKKLIKRPLESIFIEHAKKEQLVSSLNEFISREDWYVDNGIPYQFGILLYGEPGTGKSSLIKALASHLNYPIYNLSPSSLSYASSAMASLPNKCLLVIEDIDSSSMTHSRTSVVHENPKNNKANSINKIEDAFGMASLSELLNSLDGLSASHGRILIATTNHIEKLDSALIRPGRIDIKIEIGFVTKEPFIDFIHKFFPDYILNVDELYIKPNITVASLQNMVLSNKSAKEIIDAVSISVIEMSSYSKENSANKDNSIAV